MSTQPQPSNYRTVTPYLRIRGAAKAIEFYKQVFGATEFYRLKMPDSDKLMHAELQIGDSNLMLSDEFMEWGCPSPTTVGQTTVTIHVYVPDVDATFAKAVAAGARAVTPPQNMFWGDRNGKFVDPFGHEWSVATHVEDVSPEEVAKRAALCCKEA